MDQITLDSIWPEWQLTRKLGSGSYGTVYEAVRADSHIESKSAIKIISIPQNEAEIESLRSEGLNEEKTMFYLKGIVDDFVKEIQLMQSFKGTQNIVSVEDYKVVEKKDTQGWDIYIRMELLTPFTKYISDKTLSEKEVIKLGMDICSALELCSRKNVIHRDIKPENIFVNEFGDFKLGDFGIARSLENATGGLSQKGTYNYMAPEVSSGTDYNATVDVYSLGIVLYRLMNGNRLPFIDSEDQLLDPNKRAEAVKRRLGGEPLPAPSDASAALSRVILCACDPDPRKRFSDAAAFKNALINAGTGTPGIITEEMLDRTVSVRQAPISNEPLQALPEDTSSKRKKKSKAPLVALLGVLALVIIGTLVIIPKLSDKDDEDDNSASTEETTENTSEEESKDGGSDDKEEVTDVLEDESVDDLQEAVTDFSVDETLIDEKQTEVISDMLTKEEMDVVKNHYLTAIAEQLDVFSANIDCYLFLYIDDDNIPELITSNGVEDVLYYDQGAHNWRLDHTYELYYRPKEDRMIYGRIYDYSEYNDNIRIEYQYCDLHENRAAETAVVEKKPSTEAINYAVGNRIDCTESQFMEYMTRYGEMVQIQVDYDHMYRTIDEAEEAILKIQDAQQTGSGDNE